MDDIVVAKHYKIFKIFVLSQFEILKKKNQKFTQRVKKLFAFKY